MKRAPTDRPNLDDILARDFSELKVGEENLKSEIDAAIPEKKEHAAALPKAYNQRIDAVEDREAFVVKAPASKPSEANPKEEKTCLLYTSPSPRDLSTSRMPSSA